MLISLATGGVFRGALGSALVLWVFLVGLSGFSVVLVGALKPGEGGRGPLWPLALKAWLFFSTVVRSKI